MAELAFCVPAGEVLVALGAYVMDVKKENLTGQISIEGVFWLHIIGLGFNLRSVKLNNLVKNLRHISTTGSHVCVYTAFRIETMTMLEEYALLNSVYRSRSRWSDRRRHALLNSNILLLLYRFDR